MISLPKTIQQLAENRKMALCLHHVDDALFPGIEIEVREVESGELVSQPFLITDPELLQDKVDILDNKCAKILENVRLFRR